MIELVEYKLERPSESKAIRDLYKLINQVRARMIEEEFCETLSIPVRVESLERNLIAAAMHKTNGNITKAAKILDLSRVGLSKKLKTYNMGQN